MWPVTPRCGILLGAGYSKWAADLPVARELFDFAIEHFGVREPKRLERVQALKSEWDALHPDGQAEEFIADTIEDGGQAAKDVIWYIARRLSELFIWQEFHAGRQRRHVFMIDEYRCPKPGAEFLRSLCGSRLSGIITTNYDLLVEYSLTTKGFNYGIRGEVLAGRGPYPVSQWLNPVTLRGSMPLAKIHGSISWDKDAHYTDGRGGITGNVLLVAPTQDKKPPRELSPAWRLAEEILLECRALLVFGFAFNPYDGAVLQLLHEAGRHLEKVLIVDVSPPLEGAAKVWPQAYIESLAPPLDGDFEKIWNWWKST